MPQGGECADGGIHTLLFCQPGEKRIGDGWRGARSHLPRGSMWLRIARSSDTEIGLYKPTHPRADNGNFFGSHSTFYLSKNRHFNESLLSLRYPQALDGEENVPRALFTSLVPVLPGCFDLIPVRGTPFVKRSERFIQRAAEIGEPVESRGFNAPGIHMTHDQSVSFRSSERVRQDLV